MPCGGRGADGHESLLETGCTTGAHGSSRLAFGTGGNPQRIMNKPVSRMARERLCRILLI